MGYTMRTEEFATVNGAAAQLVETEAYDHRRDPAEMVGIAGDPAMPSPSRD